MRYGGEPDPTVVPNSDDLELMPEADLADVHRDPGPRLLVMNPLDNEDGSRVQVMHDGANDKVFIEVANKYKDRMSDPNLPSRERTALSVQIFKEIAERKAAIAREASGGAIRIATDAATPPEPGTMKTGTSRTRVTFDFGAIGSHVGTYDHVQVVENVVLMATAVGSTDGYYRPPPHRRMIVIIDGCPMPLVVMLVGVVPFNGFDQVIMLAVDPEDDDDDDDDADRDHDVPSR